MKFSESRVIISKANLHMSQFVRFYSNHRQNLTEDDRHKLSGELLVLIQGKAKEVIQIVNFILIFSLFDICVIVNLCLSGISFSLYLHMTLPV